jgi:hypothetical protein
LLRLPPSQGRTLLLASIAAAASQADDCPVRYAGAREGGLLLGGVLNAASCRTAKGEPCQRSGFYAEECKLPTSSTSFGVCNEEQRSAGLAVAQKLYGGDALAASPCDLWPFIRGRTLWLIG